MRGKILDFSDANRTGLIGENDGNRYEFSAADWKSEVVVAAGSKVDFVADGARAKEIYADIPSRTAASMDKNKVAAGLFAIFLGAIGIHKFYLGYSKAGIIMILVFFVGFILILPPIAISIIAFIEGIIYLTKTDEDFYQTYVVNEKQWF